MSIPTPIALGLSTSNLKSAAMRHSDMDKHTKFLALELEFLNAISGLYEAEFESRTLCQDAMRYEARGSLSHSRLELETVERRYAAALEGLGFAFSSEGLNSDTNPAHSDAPFDAPDGFTTQTDNSRMTNEDYRHKREKIEALMSWLRVNNTQDTALLVQLREDDEALLASMKHQCSQMNAEISDILVGYKDCLHRIAKVFIEMDAVYTEMEQIKAATEVDLAATVALRAEIAYRSSGPTKMQVALTATTQTLSDTEEISKSPC